MAAALIQVTTFTNPLMYATGTADGKTASTRLINVRNIISVKTRATAYLTTGVTDVVYSYPVNEAMVQVTLICTETQAAILTAANASTTPA